MWKYVSRRIKDTFERSVNQFEKRSAAGIVTSGDAKDAEPSKKHAGCRWVCPQSWASSSQGERNTNSKNWNFEHLNRTWIGAITWSSALVVGWYTSQLIHLEYKYRSEHQLTCPTRNNFISPYIQNLSLLYVKSVSKHLIGNLAPTVHLISNDGNDVQKKSGSSNTNSKASSNVDDDLGNVLNSIENKLGLAAIQNGQHEEGLNFLRSAANRSHAPALYNLGLCYEMGQGVLTDEKMAMELFRAAAALEHPGALYNLAVYYGQGRGGVARDEVTARRLLRLAAARGQPDAVAAVAALAALPDDSAAPSLAPHAYCSPYDDLVPTQTTLFVQNIM